MLRVLKHEIEAKERFVSVGVFSFERHERKANKESYFKCALNSSLQKGDKNKFMYSVSQNNTLHGNVQNMQIQFANENFWNEMGYVIFVLKKGTFLLTVPWIILATNAVET